MNVLWTLLILLAHELLGSMNGVTDLISFWLSDKFMSTILTIALLVQSALSSYVLKDEFIGNTFFDNFNLLDWNEDTCFSNFVMDYNDAYSMGLINTTSNTVYIGVDHTNKVTDNKGRKAIQIRSEKNWTQALFILGLQHMPGGLCGVWPAYWLNGPDWPNNGEIDIIEQINLDNNDQSTLHTGLNCDYSGHENINMTGKFVTWQNGNCSYQPGCSVMAQNNDSYGYNFNEHKGGVFALIVDDDGIQNWFFRRDNIPSDITNKKPDPSSWGLPFANWPFGSWCTKNHFDQLQIIFDVYFCGWSGSDSTFKSQCQDGGPAKGQTCEEFVSNNPGYFKDAYWLINYLDVYQEQ